MSSSDASFGDPGTRARILQTTWELIEDRGASLALSEVAERAGVSRQAVYLHFGDRAGLLLALVEYMDEILGRDEMVAHVFDAPTGAETVDRMVEALGIIAPKIDAVAQVLEAAQYQDEALGAAWRDRMRIRHAIIRMALQRIADEGQLTQGWTVDAAADLFYVVTMPQPWRELTRELGWAQEQYAENVAKLLRRALLPLSAGS